MLAIHSRRGRLTIRIALTAILASAQSGCLFLAAGGAATGYAYYKGRICQSYCANYADTWSATQTALAELGMIVTKEKSAPGKGEIQSRTADGDKVRIRLETIQSRIPADGVVTRVCVRVATFGDQFVSDRILNQVSAHLVPAASLAVSPEDVSGAPLPMEKGMP